MQTEWKNAADLALIEAVAAMYLARARRVAYQRAARKTARPANDD